MPSVADMADKLSTSILSDVIAPALILVPVIEPAAIFVAVTASAAILPATTALAASCGVLIAPSLISVRVIKLAAGEKANSLE